MPKRPRPIDNYVAELEAKYGNDFKSNRTIVAELVDKERTQERTLYKELARIVSALYEQWDQEKHVTLGEDEHKSISFEPELIVYPDGSKRFSCKVSLSHADLSLLGSDTKWLFLSETHPFTAMSFDEFKYVITAMHDRFLPYVQEGFQPNMYSILTVTPEIYFPGYCPSPIPAYVTSIRKNYSDPYLIALSHDSVEKMTVAIRPWFPVPDEPDYMLVTYITQNRGRLYNLPSILEGFHPLIGLNEAKSLKRGIAVNEDGMYALAWQGITPFARELVRWHTQEEYYIQYEK